MPQEQEATHQLEDQQTEQQVGQQEGQQEVQQEELLLADKLIKQLEDKLIKQPKVQLILLQEELLEDPQMEH